MSGEDEIIWLGPDPEERRLTEDYCKRCGIARGVDVLNYKGPCAHIFETVLFAPATAGDLAQALMVAIRCHADQRDKQGEPYLLHVLRVVEAVSDEAKVVAALHDVLEDDDALVLREVGHACLLSRRDERALVLLTRLEGVSYADYIGRIAKPQNIPQMSVDIAREVKLADLRDNLGRIPLIPGDSGLARRERALWASLKARYEKAIATLESASSPTPVED